MLYDMFPLMKTLYNSEPTAATECQDLMGMSFRTFHFDGVVRVPGYLAWLMWVFLHVYKLVGFRNRLSVMTQWAFAYLSYQRSVRLITQQTGD